MGIIEMGIISIYALTNRTQYALLGMYEIFNTQWLNCSFAKAGNQRNGKVNYSKRTAGIIYLPLKFDNLWKASLFNWQRNIKYFQKPHRKLCAYLFYESYKLKHTIRRSHKQITQYLHRITYRQMIDAGKINLNWKTNRYKPAAFRWSDNS